jgi:hypothetical protein
LALTSFIFVMKASTWLMSIVSLWSFASATKKGSLSPSRKTATSICRLFWFSCVNFCYELLWMLAEETHKAIFLLRLFHTRMSSYWLFYKSGWWWFRTKSHAIDFTDFLRNRVGSSKVDNPTVVILWLISVKHSY